MFGLSGCVGNFTDNLKYKRNDLEGRTYNGQTICKYGCGLCSYCHDIRRVLQGVYKVQYFTGQTNLSVMHTHYFLLGMFFFLMLMLAEKVFSFSDQKTGKLLIAYQLGLNITGLGFLMRGLTQVWGTTLSKGLDASISGIAGIGHTFMGICIVLLLLKIKKSVN